MAKETDLAFSAALVRLKKGDEIARPGFETGHSLVLRDGVIVDVIETGGEQEYAPSQADILAEDWFVSKEAE